MSIEMPPQLAPPDRTRWLEIALIFLVFFIVGGAPAPHVNETYYLTKAKHYWQPEWCAGDPFLQSADAHLVFYWTIGWLAKFFSLTTVAWIGRCTAWLLLALSWHSLSSRVFQSRWLPTLSAMLFVTLIDYTNFAGEWVVGGVEGKCFAYALVFWGLAAMVEGKWSAVWPRLGLASAFHVLVGGWSTLAIGLVWLIETKFSSQKLREQLPSLLLGGLLALPGIIPALLLTQGVDPQTIAEANRTYVFDRIPHHLAPLHLPLPELLRKSIRFEIVLASFLILWVVSLRKTTPENLTPANLGTLSRLFKFAAWCVVFAALGLIWELVFWNHQDIAAKVLKYYFFRLADIAIPLVVCLAVGWLIHCLRKQESLWCVGLLLVSIAFPCWHFLDITSNRYVDPRPPADRRLRSLHDWHSACEWARVHTPQESLFLVPRGSQSFNWHTGRPDLVNWKDVPQDAKALVQWRKCFFEVFYGTDPFGNRKAYQSLAKRGTKQILDLARKYDIDFVLTVEYPPLGLPVAYSNASYTIYAIE